jgi:L-ascorbate metabolism protein UlaG (beta-lactamase superfamily)
MTIKYLGHACFLLTASDGLRVIIDPYESGAFGNALAYAPITDAADVVVVTHEHADHNFVRGVPGDPIICRASCVAHGVEFRAVPVPHDEADGSKRGVVNAFSFELDGIRVCHLGDVGAALSAPEVSALGPVDLLMVPVGGTFTVDAAGAQEIVAQLAPRIVIPMHFSTRRTTLPLASVDAFLDGEGEVVRVNGPEFSLAPGDLPDTPHSVLLDPAN